MARGRHYAKLSLLNAPRLSFSGLCILLFLFLSLCRFCVFVFFFFCSHWSLVDVPLIFFCPADHVSDWQPRIVLGTVEARSVNVKKKKKKKKCMLRSGSHTQLANNYTVFSLSVFLGRCPLLFLFLIGRCHFLREYCVPFHCRLSFL